MMPENLDSLHKHEEQIRVDSLSLIGKNQNLRDHLSMIHGAMGIIYSFAHEHVKTSDNELTIQYLGLRLFNSAAASLKLGFSGYYQFAFSLVRDIFETIALLDYMSSCPDQIAIWKESDTRQRIQEFGPGAIRNFLNNRDKFTGNKRKEIYDRLSEYASHATAPGFKLLAPQGLAQIGPFLSEKYLKAWVEETVKFLVHGAIIFTGHFVEIELTLMQSKANFLEQVENWHKRYMGSNEDQG